MAGNHANCYGELLQIARGDDAVTRRRLDAFAAYARGERPAPQHSPVTLRRPSMLLIASFLLGGLVATVVLSCTEVATREKIFAYFNLNGKA